MHTKTYQVHIYLFLLTIFSPIYYAPRNSSCTYVILRSTYLVCNTWCPFFPQEVYLDTYVLYDME